MNYKKMSIAVAAVLLSSAAMADSQGTVVGANGQGTATSQSGGGQSSLDYNPVYSGDTNYKSDVASAPGIGLVAGINTCLGSIGGGLSTSVVGLSLAGTNKDADCNMRSNSRELFNMGARSAAFVVECSDDRNRYAIAVSGGIPYVRNDGVVVRRACPIKQADWEAKGEPLLNPITGQPYTDDELNPPARVAQAPVPKVDPQIAEQAALMQRMVALQAQTPKGYHVAIVAGQPTIWKDGVALPKLADAPVASLPGKSTWELAKTQAPKTPEQIEADAQAAAAVQAIAQANAATTAKYAAAK